MDPEYFESEHARGELLGPFMGSASELLISMCASAPDIQVAIDVSPPLPGPAHQPFCLFIGRALKPHLAGLGLPDGLTLTWRCRVADFADKAKAWPAAVGPLLAASLSKALAIELDKRRHRQANAQASTATDLEALTSGAQAGTAALEVANKALALARNKLRVASDLIQAMRDAVSEDFLEPVERALMRDLLAQWDKLKGRAPAESGHCSRNDVPPGLLLLAAQEHRRAQSTCAECPLVQGGRDINADDRDEGYYTCSVDGVERWGEDPKCPDSVNEATAAALLKDLRNGA